MADIKISQLDSGTTLGGTEYIPIVQNGVTVKTTAQAIADLGGGSPTLITKNITQNGTYNASSDNADGYSSVTVNVSGGGGASVTFTPVKVFDETGIGASSWTDTDGLTTMTVDGGTYTATAGEKIVVNATNQLRMSFPIDSSYYMFGIRCKVDSSFSPIQSNNWYDCSCILGQELGGEQKDYAIVIDRNGYFALGWANSTITSTTISALDGNEHELFVVAESAKIRLFIDGNEEVVVDKIMNGGNMTNIGVFWNRSGGNTRVNGEIYAVGYWIEVEPTITYVLPTL